MVFASFFNFFFRKIVKLVQRRNQKESWRFFFEIYKVSKTIRFEWRKIFGTGLYSNCFWALPCTGCSKFSRFEVFGGCNSFCHLIPPKCYHWDVLTLMSCSYSCGRNCEHLMKSFKCVWFMDGSLSLHIFTDWLIQLFGAFPNCMFLLKKIIKLQGWIGIYFSKFSNPNASLYYSDSFCTKFLLPNLEFQLACVKNDWDHKLS